MDAGLPIRACLSGLAWLLNDLYDKSTTIHWGVRSRCATLTTTVTLGCCANPKETLIITTLTIRDAHLRLHSFADHMCS